MGVFLTGFWLLLAWVELGMTLNRIVPVELVWNGKREFQKVMYFFLEKNTPSGRRNEKEKPCKQQELHCTEQWSQNLILTKLMGRKANSHHKTKRGICHKNTQLWVKKCFKTINTCKLEVKTANFFNGLVFFPSFLRKTFLTHGVTQNEKVTSELLWGSWK